MNIGIAQIFQPWVKIIYNPPFDGAVAPCAVVDIVVAVRAVIAADVACAKLDRLSCICRKRHGGEHTRRHAKAKQDTKQPFSCRSHVVTSVLPFFDSLKSYFISSMANSLYITSVAIALISSD